MRIAVIGGAGARTPAAMYALAQAAGRLGLAIDEVALYDIDAGRLAMMGQITQAMLAETDAQAGAHAARLRVTTTDRAETALDGADFVILTVRVGGEAGRAADERIALNHGCIGQETTGAAGFAYALRSIPVVLRYAEMAGRLAPSCTIINFTNPAGLVTQALHRLSPVRFIGVCDSPQGIADRMAAALGVAEAELDWRYIGLNHLGWINSARREGRDVLPELLAGDQTLAAALAGEVVPPELARHLGMLPNEYCYFYYYRDVALARQLAAPETRGEMLQRFDADLARAAAQVAPGDTAGLLDCFAAYLDRRERSYLSVERGAARDLPERDARAVIRASGEGYFGIAMRVMAALSGGGPQRIVLNVPNEGTLAGLADDDVIETRCEVTPAGICPLPAPALPPETLALLQTVKAYERLTAEAALSGSRDLAVRALTHHPLVASYPLAESLVDALLAANRAYLPSFSA